MQACIGRVWTRVSAFLYGCMCENPLPDSTMVFLNVIFYKLEQVP